MTGPMYNDERLQELAEDNTWLKDRLRDAEVANAEYAVKMSWTPAQWDDRLKQEYQERVNIRRELAKTKARLAAAETALEDALHDANRWRQIAGAPDE